MKISLYRIFIIFTLVSGIAAAVVAETNTKRGNKPGPAPADKGSQSTSPLVDKIREVGNEASKGIHRATQGIRDIGDKVGKKTKDPEKGK